MLHDPLHAGTHFDAYGKYNCYSARVASPRAFEIFSESHDRPEANERMINCWCSREEDRQNASVT